MRPVDSALWVRADYVRFYSEKWSAPVIPIGPKKGPTVKWADYQARMPSEGELRAWFVDADSPPWGLALVCGAVAGNLFRLDIDSEGTYKELRAAGAFPNGASIARSTKGHYGVFLRADMIPFSIQEYSIPDFMDVGISGDRKLGIVPDAPDRTWLRLYEDVPTVNYEAWLLKYLGYEKGAAGHSGDEVTMVCPYHEDKTPSLCINLEKRVYYCQGCGASGKLYTLLKDSRLMNFTVPDSVSKALMNGLRLPEVGWGVGLGETLPPPLVEGLIESGENAKLLISGATGVGKTSLALSLAVPIAQGKPALGRLEVPRQLKVAYTNFEQRGESVVAYVQQMEPLFGIPGQEWLVRIDGFNLKLADPDVQANFLETLAVGGTDILVLDSIGASVNNLNDPDEVTLVMKFVSEVVDLGVGVIVLHHTVSGTEDIKGPERALGWLGKQLVRWSASKFVYEAMGGKRTYFARLRGKTRRWGDVDYAISYESLTRAALIIDWDDVPEDEEGDKARPLGKDPRLVETQQVVELARRLGFTIVGIAQEIGVTDRIVQYWRAGDKTPDDDNWRRILILRGKLLGQEDEGQDSAPPVHPSGPAKATTGPEPGATVAGEEGEGGALSGSRAHSKNIYILESTEGQDSVSPAEWGKGTCAECPLKAMSPVPLAGPGHKEYMLVDEAPGEGELKRGELSMGLADRPMRDFLRNTCLDPKDCFFTALALCRPPLGKPPGTKVMKACLSRLKAEIATVKPRVVITLGAVVQKALLPGYNVPRFHGKQVLVNGQLYCIMYRPAEALFMPRQRWDVERDFEHMLEEGTLVTEVVGDYTIAGK